MMDNNTLISRMYEEVLNGKKFERTPEFVSEEYVARFTDQNKPLFTAFPDIQFHLKRLVSEDESVVALYSWTGTHTHPYRSLPATNKKVTVEGVSIYRIFRDRVVENVVMPDKWSFFLQLGVVDETALTERVDSLRVYFVDEFLIPESSLEKFKEAVQKNRDYIRQLDGFVSDMVMIAENENGTYTMMTVAIWQNMEVLQNAKERVRAHYKEIGFDPAAFMQGLDVRMKRTVFKKFLQ